MRCRMRSSLQGSTREALPARPGSCWPSIRAWKKLRNARRRLLNETRKLQGQNVEDETSISVRQFRQDAINLFSIPEGQRKELGTELREIGQRIASGERVAYEELHELFEKLLDAGRVAPDNGGEGGTERRAAA